MVFVYKSNKQTKDGKDKFFTYVNGAAFDVYFEGKTIPEFKTSKTGKSYYAASEGVVRLGCYQKDDKADPSEKDKLYLRVLENKQDQKKD